ncbi:hypothetical protein [Chryseobacterium chendengshani]|uniref:hypothetical protein n=1 Tax=Chryseobacterium sp. LJ756 TaxID=2864113 RepID=UPI001C644D1A|nr:hypothetical protein [Chryseobacterium sp. LJ756]MBW7674655.1 hypothetical protein [Chryseobacterium sp. LJ756]
MKNIIFLFILISGNFFGQNIAFRINDKIYELDQKIRKGDFTSFLEIGNYLESDDPLTEYLGYHIIHTNEANVAKRIISENSFFLQNEFKFDSTISVKKYREFLIKNQNKIAFSDLADAFLLTPFEDRKTDFQIQELTQTKLDFLESKRSEIFNSNWLKTNNIDNLINQKDSRVLLVLSSLFLKNRYRFNEHKNNNAEIINLIRLLTKSNIAVPDESGQMNYHIEEDFYEISKLNLVIFFANHYKNYKWNESKNSFENSQLKQVKNDIENDLFDSLSNEDDSIALNSFIKLTRSNPEKVIALAEQFDKDDIDFNYALPTFPYRFLKQLVYLTDYCKKNNIDFIGNTDLQNSINVLKTDLTFAERRKLENSLIYSLTLDEITAFEYWCLIYEKDWQLTYSAGRIIDKFYSKNWNKTISNKKHLESYLLKSKLFEDLGIIGLCHNYVIKFKGSSDDIIASLESLQTENDKVKLQIVKAIEFAKIQIIYKEPEKKDWYGNIDSKVKISKLISKK